MLLQVQNLTRAVTLGTKLYKGCNSLFKTIQGLFVQVQNYARAVTLGTKLYKGCYSMYKTVQLGCYSRYKTKQRLLLKVQNYTMAVTLGTKLYNGCYSRNKTIQGLLIQEQNYIRAKIKLFFPITLSKLKTLKRALHFNNKYLQCYKKSMSKLVR